MKGNDNDMTRATFTNRLGNHNDMSMLINHDTSRQAKGIINKLNSDMRTHGGLTSVEHAENYSHFLSKDDSVNQRSAVLLRSAHNILGMHDSGNEDMIDHRPTSRSQIGSRSMVSHHSTSRLGSAQHIENNPNVMVRNKGLTLADAREINKHLSKEEQRKKAEEVKKYVETIVEKVERLENHQKDFKNYDKAQLDDKDEEIRKWMVTQKKVDEERRVEIENRLRTIFQDKVSEGTGYSPSEGFLLSIDFMY